MSSPWTENLETVSSGDPRGMVAELAEEDLKQARTWLRVIGVLGLIGGAAAIVVPAVASVTIAIFMGWLLLLVGVTMLVHEIRMRGREHRSWWDIVTALITAVAGLCLLLFPLTGTLTLTFFLISWFIVTGVLQLVAWWQTRGAPGSGLLALNGVVGLILGILIAADLPSSAGWAIGLLVGVNLIFLGVRALAAASILSRLASGRVRPA
jgi:uncharacterized membrane protein HdeD (DUF308 family)